MRFSFLAFCLLMTPVSAQAHQTIEVMQSFAIATVAGMENGAAYVSVENTGPRDAELVGVSGDAAEFVQIHTHVMDGELKRMVAASLPLTLAPGEQLIMKPGGFHVMFLGLVEAFEADDELNITMHFEGRHVRDLDVVIPIYSFEEAQALIGEAQEMDHSNHDHETANHEGHGEMDGDVTDPEHSGHNH